MTRKEYALARGKMQIDKTTQSKFMKDYREEFRRQLKEKEKKGKVRKRPGWEEED